MPTYDYECQKCKKTFEVSQKITDKSLTKCIKKGCSGKVKRLIGSGGGIIFKGSGFYATDYRSAKYKKREKEDRGAVSSCESCPKKESGCGK